MSRRRRLLNILLLTHRVPYPPNRGDRIRAYHLLRFLSERGNVWLGALADEPTPTCDKEHLASLCHEMAIVPVRRNLRWASAIWSFACGNSATEGLFRSARLTTQIRKWSDGVQFDAIVIFCSSMFQYLAAANHGGAKNIVDLVDVDSQKFLDYAVRSRGPKSWLCRLEGKRVRRLEELIVGQSDAVTVVSEPEADLLRTFCPNEKIHSICNGVDTNYFQPQPNQLSDSPLAIFVGVLDYPPNIDGVKWFCEAVWPGVRQRVPQARFSIVGRQPTPEVKHLARIDGVDVVGEVPDVRNYLNQAGVSVAPLRIARGVQNKVLEAMSAGIPVVASPQALTGLQISPGQDAVMADDAEVWQHEIVRLLEDEGRRQDLANKGRAFVVNHHSWQNQLAKFDFLIGSSGPAELPATAAVS